MDKGKFSEKKGGLRLAGWAVLAVAALLGGCNDDDRQGKGDDAAVVLAHPKVGFAKLGTLKDAQVAVYDLHTSAPIHTTTTDEDGRFEIDLGGHPLDEIYRIEVSGGLDVDYDDSATPGQAPVENKGTLSTLATGKQIVETGVSVSIVSDILARRFGDRVSYNPAALVARELNECAEALIGVDINGDDRIDYRDVLVFDPEDASHRDALEIDYHDFYLPDREGNTIMSLYHENRQELLDDELDGLVSDLIDTHLPDEAQSSLAAVSFVVEGRGYLRADDVLPVQLDGTQPSGTVRYLQAIDKTAPKIAVTADPSADHQVIGWEGCEPDAGNPNLCYVTPDTTKTVVAVIAGPEHLKPGVLAVHVPNQPGVIGLVMEIDHLVLTAEQANPIVAEMDTALASLREDASRRLFIGGELAKEAALKVNALIERSVVHGVVRYVFTYETANVFDAVQDADTYAPPQPLSVDSIVSVSFDTDGDGVLEEVHPKNEASADYVPGPNPVDPAMDSVLCAEGETQKLLADGRDACVSVDQYPIDTAEGEPLTCTDGLAAVEALDGEYFCANPAEIYDEPAVTAARARAALPAQYASRALTRSKFDRALTQPIITTRTRPEFKAGDLVWLVGQGQAVYLAHNVFMVDRTDGKGVTMVTADPDMEVVANGSKLALAAQACSKDNAAPECRLMGVRHMVQTKALLLGPNGLEFKYNPEKAKWLKLKFKINVDITGTASGNFNMGLVYYEASSRGNIQITPILNTTVTADAAGLYTKLTDSSRGDASPSDKQKSGEPIIEQTVFKIDFIEKTPGVNEISPVIESELGFSIGIDAAGQAKLNVLATYKQVVAWDIDSRFTYRVIGANTNIQNFKVSSTGYGGITVRGDVNASVGAFAKAYMTIGPRKIIPKLFELEAKYYPIKVELLGKGLLSYQTDPELVAKQAGQKFCYAGALQLTVKEAAEASAKIQLKSTDSTINEILGYIGYTTLLEKSLFSFDVIKYTVGTKVGTLKKEEEPVFGAVALDAQKIGTPNLSAEYTEEYLEEGDKLQCEKPSPDNMPAEISVGAGRFKLDQGESLYIKKYELALQTDGNLVIYNWNGKRGGAVWAAGTDGKGAGYGRARFQDDGNLVVEDIHGDVPFSTGTYGVGANTIKFTEAGALEIYASGRKLWSSAGGVSLPGSYTYDKGGLRLNAGESLITPSRAVVMQSDGNLVVYRMDNGRRQNSLWSSGTHGAGQGCHAIFQTDGNFVVYDAKNSPRWSSATHNRGARQLKLQPDGNLVIYDAEDKALWATGT